MAAEVKAETIGRAAYRDRQVAVPVRPAVRRGVRLRQAGDAVVLDGSDKRQVFTGGFARESLRRLVDACDGTATHAQLAAATGLDETVVYKSLALLWASGVVEEGVPAGEQPSTAPEFACFLSRLGNSTGANPSWTQGARRLRDATVRLAGYRPLVEAAERCLTGVCTVSTDAVTDAVADAAADADLVVVFETPQSSPTELAALHERCRRDRRPLLRVRADTSSMVVGPYVDPEFTPCLRCSTAGEDDLAGDPPQSSYELIAGLVAHHVIALTARSTMTHLPLDAAVVDLATLATRYRASASRPGCPDCSFSAGPTAPVPPSGALYEAAVAIPPRRFLDPKGHLAHYQSSNIKLQSEFRDWPSCPRVPLPAADVSRLAGAPAADRAALRGPDAALLLAVAFGIREQTADGWVKRWTAAAGNIGSAGAYLLCRDASVLPVGGYAYVEQDHALAQLTADVPPGDRPLTLVVTANLKKVVRKYGTFGLKLALLDAGVALSAAREVATHLALDFSLVTDWDDERLSGLLGISPDQEPVAAVMELG
ncbi:tpaE [Kitasatospora sp. NPDC058965]|uniref:tpaE n=1 Tax=Kitasatospora sp. NPDC058965 TaxID=3346682 RepID=UPI003682A3F7